ncbi:hypothetical protein HK102_014020 [Quaeritorhiza haematococci]|nr:hypothetical protein HK102_014020 [Quaeritorhiza haematococci]
MRVSDTGLRSVPPMFGKLGKRSSSDAVDSMGGGAGGSNIGAVIVGSNGQMASQDALESLPSLPLVMEDDVQLPLTTEMAMRFDALLNNYKKLSEYCLFSLHIELRCHSMYYLDLAMREGNYYLESEPLEPDPYILSLNEDLTICEEIMSTALPTRRIRFLFDGLANVMTHILCTNLRHIKRVNAFGVNKLIRNVQSLQQNLTNIAAVHEKGLDRARQYFELLKLSGDGIIRYMEAHPRRFTFDEYKVVLDLVYDEATLSSMTDEEVVSLINAAVTNATGMPSSSAQRAAQAAATPSISAVTQEWMNSLAYQWALLSNSAAPTANALRTQYKESLQRMKDFFVRH